MFDVKRKFNFMKFFEIPKTVYFYVPDFYVEDEVLPKKIRDKYFKNSMKERVCSHCGSKINKTEDERPFNILAEIDSSDLAISYNFFDDEIGINNEYALCDVSFKHINDNYFFQDDVYFYCGKLDKNTCFLFSSYEEAINVLTKHKIKNILFFDKKERFKAEINTIK